MFSDQLKILEEKTTAKITATVLRKVVGKIEIETKDLNFKYPHMLRESLKDFSGNEIKNIIKLRVRKKMEEAANTVSKSIIKNTVDDITSNKVSAEIISLIENKSTKPSIHGNGVLRVPTLKSNTISSVKPLRSIQKYWEKQSQIKWIYTGQIM